ncbi:MAG: hypothetical protein JW982_02385 [Spirochaetes bacterium]|nr:hypothetical protein [Spirochaetota bacterium]
MIRKFFCLLLLLISCQKNVNEIHILSGYHFNNYPYLIEQYLRANDAWIESYLSSSSPGKYVFLPSGEFAEIYNDFESAVIDTDVKDKCKNFSGCKNLLKIISSAKESDASFIIATDVLSQDNIYKIIYYLIDLRNTCEIYKISEDISIDMMNTKQTDRDGNRKVIEELKQLLAEIDK